MIGCAVYLSRIFKIFYGLMNKPSITNSPPFTVKQQIFPSQLKSCQHFSSQSFPRYKQTVDSSHDTACDVSRVYRCHSCCNNFAGGCTALPKSCLVCQAYEKLLKEFQTTEVRKGLGFRPLVSNQICTSNVHLTTSILFERLVVYLNYVGTISY
jgi:hypothetical protein